MNELHLIIKKNTITALVVKSGSGKTTLTHLLTGAKKANAHEFFMKLPLGYETKVGENSVKLSGGERQSAIAGAIIKNAPIIILDEATSALDTTNEKLILDSISKLMQNKTTIMVAHRESSIKKQMWCMK